MPRPPIPSAFDPNGVGLQNGHFIGLPFTEAEAQLVLLSVPWDVTTSYAAGTATAPTNILEASTQLDLYDPFFPDAWKYGLFMQPVDPDWLARNNVLRAEAESYIQFLEAGGQLSADPAMQARLQRINTACDELRNWVKSQAANLLDQG